MDFMFEEEYRLSNDKVSDIDSELKNYIVWLEHQLAQSRHQLAIMSLKYRKEECIIHSTDFFGKCFKCGEQVFERK